MGAGPCPPSYLAPPWLLQPNSLNGMHMGYLLVFGSAFLFLHLGHASLPMPLNGTSQHLALNSEHHSLREATSTTQLCHPPLIFYKIPTAGNPTLLYYKLVFSLLGETERKREREGRSKGGRDRETDEESESGAGTG